MNYTFDPTTIQNNPTEILSCTPILEVANQMLLRNARIAIIVLIILIEASYYLDVYINKHPDHKRIKLLNKINNNLIFAKYAPVAYITAYLFAILK